MGGIRCQACRRYVLRWPHIALLALLSAAVVFGFLDILFRLTAP